MLSLAEVAAAFDHCGIALTPVEVSVLKHGTRSQVVRVQLSQAKPASAILKVVESDGRWHLENEIAALELATSVSSPKVLGKFWDDDDCGWLALQDLGGTSLHQVLASSPKEQVAEWYRQIGQQLALLHTIDPGHGFGFLNDTRSDEASYRTRRVETILARPLDIELASALEQSFLTVRENQRRAADAVLCHQDLHHGNVLIDRSGELCGVIDFENAVAGDPLQDLARSTLLATARTGPWAADEIAWGYRPDQPLRRDERQRLRFWELVQAGDIIQATNKLGGREHFVDRIQHAVIAKRGTTAT